MCLDSTYFPLNKPSYKKCIIGGRMTQLHYSDALYPAKRRNDRDGAKDGAGLDAQLMAINGDVNGRGSLKWII